MKERRGINEWMVAKEGGACLCLSFLSFALNAFWWRAGRSFDPSVDASKNKQNWLKGVFSSTAEHV